MNSLKFFFCFNESYLCRTTAARSPPLYLKDSFYNVYPLHSWDRRGGVSDSPIQFIDVTFFHPPWRNLWLSDHLFSRYFYPRVSLISIHAPEEWIRRLSGDAFGPVDRFLYSRTHRGSFLLHLISSPTTGDASFPRISIFVPPIFAFISTSLLAPVRLLFLCVCCRPPLIIE